MPYDVKTLTAPVVGGMSINIFNDYDRLRQTHVREQGTQAVFSQWSCFNSTNPDVPVRFLSDVEAVEFLWALFEQVAVKETLPVAEDLSVLTGVKG